MNNSKKGMADRQDNELITHIETITSTPKSVDEPVHRCKTNIGIGAIWSESTRKIRHPFDKGTTTLQKRPLTWMN